MKLVVFTRWPKPGSAKTRLIPALGAADAADLHRRLTERTLAVCRASGLAIEIRTTGAPVSALGGWLGGIESIVDQGDGDLGARLRRAAADTPVLLIGADVPNLTAERLQRAAAALRTAPVVIGPAEDGGYWLLGLAVPLPELFDRMPWGTATVYAETVARLTTPPVVLETLADLDRPEDLARWPDL